MLLAEISQELDRKISGSRSYRVNVVSKYGGGEKRGKQ